MPLDLVLAGKGVTAVASRSVPWMLVFQWNPMDSLFRNEEREQESRGTLEHEEDNGELNGTRGITLVTTLSAALALSPERPLSLSRIPLIFSAAGPLGDAPGSLASSPVVASYAELNPGVEIVPEISPDQLSAFHPLRDTQMHVAEGIAIIIFMAVTGLGIVAVRITKANARAQAEAEAQM